MENDHYIRLGKGSHPADEEDLKRILEKIAIPFTFENQRIKLLYKNIEAKKYQEILWYPAENHEAGGNGGFRSWKYFIRSMYGPKVRTIALELGVALFVKSLGAAGITVVSSCDGHEEKPPYISFYGHFNACWFMVLYKYILNSMSLHYDWKIENWRFVDPKIIACSRTGIWDLELVLEDTYKMACFLLMNGEQISKLKKELFGANRNSTRKRLKQTSAQELIEWMELKFLEKTDSQKRFNMEYIKGLFD